MQLRCFSHAAEATDWVAEHLAQGIRSFSPSQRPERPWWSLGLPTGSTPIPIYRRWVAMHRQGELSFNAVVTFNMDEYLGLESSDSLSFSAFMHQHLFNHIDLPSSQRYLFNGATVDPEGECRAFQAHWERLGGVDLQLAGVGREGHLAFNEAWSSLQSSVRVVQLAASTRQANGQAFEQARRPIPQQALTVGLRQILEARKLVVVALGPEKAEAVQRGLEGPLSHRTPLSILQWHPNALLVCDFLAASQLQPSTLEAFGQSMR